MNLNENIYEEMLTTEDEPKVKISKKKKEGNTYYKINKKRMLDIYLNKQAMSLLSDKEVIVEIDEEEGSVSLKELTLDSKHNIYTINFRPHGGGHLKITLDEEQVEKIEEGIYSVIMEDGGSIMTLSLDKE